MARFDEKGVIILNRRKITLNEQLVNTYLQKQNEDKSGTQILTELIKRIAEGEYDEVIKHMPNKKTVQKNVFDKDIEKAKEKAKILGYSRLSDLVEDVLKYEIDKNY